MTGMQIAHITPGVVVFARVGGFPWWPAVIQHCPHNERWTNKGKFWVIFFNETNGAWVKPSELRAFDAYNQDLCMEYNSGPPKFRRYREKIEKAIDLALDHLSNPGQRNPNAQSIEGESPTVEDTPLKEERSAVEERPAREETTGVAQKPAVRTGADVIPVDDPPARNRDADEEEDEITQTRAAMQPGQSGLRRSSRQVSKQPEVDGKESDHANEEGQRPRRKRMRTERSQQPAELRQDRAAEGRGKRGDEEGSANRYTGAGNASAVAVIPDNMANGTAVVAGRKQENGNNQPQSVGERLRPRATRQSTRGNDQNLTEDLNEGRPAPVVKRASRRIAMRRVTTRRLAQEPIPRSEPNPDNRPDPAATRERYISELNELVGPRARKRLGDVGRNVLRSRAGTGSVAVGSSRPESNSGQGTDSEEGPERFRKIMNGSLEAAAEDLVERAVRRENGGVSESVSRREDILDMDTVTLGGNELVSSILNRITDLERDVLVLRQRAAGEEQATLGEDASAAGLKSAVEALAAAADAYARARDYNAGVIGRSLELLWPVGGHFPLAGADGELLRTITKSLVVGCCRHSENNGARNSRTVPARKTAPRAASNQADEHRFNVRNIASQSRAINGTRSNRATPEEIMDGSPAGRWKGSDANEEIVFLVPRSSRAQRVPVGSKKTRNTRRSISQAHEEGNAPNAVKASRDGAAESEEVVDGDQVDEQMQNNAEGSGSRNAES